MGQIAGTLKTRDVGLSMDDDPTFDRQAGFSAPRKQREMVAKEEHLKSARIPVDARDFCAHYLLDYQICRYNNMPWVYKCAHEKHNYLNCQHADYILRMKEFEREKRLRRREQRLAAAA